MLRVESGKKREFVVNQQSMAGRNAQGPIKGGGKIGATKKKETLADDVFARHQVGGGSVCSEG